MATTVTYSIAATGSVGQVKLTDADGKSREVSFGSGLHGLDRLADPALWEAVSKFLDDGTTSGTVTITAA